MDNVINLFSRRTPAKAGQQSRGGDTAQQTSSALSLNTTTNTNTVGFSDVAERNRQNQQRLRKEREQANKNVLKSYRIK